MVQFWIVALPPATPPISIPPPSKLAVFPVMVLFWIVVLPQAVTLIPPPLPFK